MAWQRARRFGNRYFDSNEQVSYKNLVSIVARGAAKNGAFPIQGCVRLRVELFFKRPKRLNRLGKRHKRLGFGVNPGQIFNPHRTDADNCLKMIGDALNGIIWNDDSQIVETIVRKYYHEFSKAPRTEIEIEEV